MRVVESEESEMSESSELAQDGCMRRAPLEQGRDGLVKDHCSFYFSAKNEKQPRVLRLAWRIPCARLAQDDIRF
jgi:hypothetical protein